MGAECTGLVSNIQRFSIHDGPGIRTTVFMKGCPLSCRWCSNPELVARFPQIMTRDQVCQLCGKCAAACPRGAITVGKKREIDRAKCDLCLECARVCATGAIRTVGQLMTVSEVMSEVVRDEVFYQNSRGGVSVSGGEPLFQWRFVRSLLCECQQRGIHTALETCGYATLPVLEKVLEYTDLVLFDIKHMDPQAHKRGTGVDNRRILRNARVAASTKRTWLRVPLIPGYNDSEENLNALISFAKDVKAEKVSILGYHEFGKVKYEQLGRLYTMDVEPPNEEYLRAKAKLLRDAGIKVTVNY